MNFGIFFYFSSIIISMTFAASPVFLAEGGTKICTLNNVGTLPSKGHPSVKYPVYQKVCRQVIPTALGDQMDDNDEEMTEDENLESKKEKEINQLRRAIIVGRMYRPVYRVLMDD